MKNLLIVSFVLILSACGTRAPSTSTDQNQAEAKSSLNQRSISLTYQLTENGCDTGIHSFESKTAYCNGLKSSKLNQGCALTLRKQRYQQDCADAGVYIETPDVIEEPSANASPTPSVLKVTVLNFLTGGIEPCPVKEQNYFFSTSDENTSLILCANSKIKVMAVSNFGTVTFRAIDLETNQELQPASEDSEQVLTLGKTKGMIRYNAVNPYGYIYLMAEEVTGLDPVLLNRWNELNEQMSKLKAKVLTEQKDGAKPSAIDLESIKALDEQMSKLAVEIQKSKGIVVY